MGVAANKNSPSHTLLRCPFPSPNTPPATATVWGARRAQELLQPSCAGGGLSPGQLQQWWAGGIPLPALAEEHLNEPDRKVEPTCLLPLSLHSSGDPLTPGRVRTAAVLGRGGRNGREKEERGHASEHRVGGRVGILAFFKGLKSPTATSATPSEKGCCIQAEKGYCIQAEKGCGGIAFKQSSP